MKIFKVTRTDRWSYDDYDSFICVAVDAEQARKLMPDPYYIRKEDGLYFQYADGSERKEDDKRGSEWPADLKDISVSEVSPALFSKPEIILASFNAG